MTSDFLAADYAVFVVFLLVSLGIGVFFAFRSYLVKKSRPSPDKLTDHGNDNGSGGETMEFLLGNRDMPMFPVSLSILASFLSANTVMGNPGVVYQYGIIYWFFCLHNLASIPVAAHLFMPIFHDLQLTSVYEYLQLRFSFPVRLAASIIFVIQMVFYMAVVLYAPAIALQSVTGIKAWISVLVTGLVCTIYTVLGGLKAVVWTDVFQMIVVFAGLILMMVIGTGDVGGVGVIFEAAVNGSRINPGVFDPDPTVEYTLWSTLIGGMFTALTVYVANQTLVQRYLSLRHLRQAQWALYLNAPLLILVVSVSSFLGLIMFAKHQDCDPLKAGTMRSGDQLMAAMIPATLGKILPGLSGLFVACVFSASISTLSSGVNALAAICVEDFFKPLSVQFSLSSLSTDFWMARLSRGLATCFGLLTIAFAFLVDGLGSSVVTIALTIFGLCGGPLLGLFIQGVFCPWIDDIGAFIGLLASFSSLIVVKVGAIVSGYRPPTLPTSIEGCDLLNATVVPGFSNVTASSLTLADGPPPVHALFRLSFFWYAPLAVLVALLVGSVVSVSLRCVTRRRFDKIPSNLLSPVWRKSIFVRNPTRVSRADLRGAANQVCADDDVDDETTKL